MVYVVEGEKDADRLANALGVVATTNSGGAEKWKPFHSVYLKGHPVIILPDNDDAGERHALQVAASTHQIGCVARIVQLPGLGRHGDVSDWLNGGGTLEGLERLAAEVTPYGASENGQQPAAALEQTRMLWEGSRHREPARNIIDRLNARGKFITAEGVPYYFDDHSKVLSHIESFEMAKLLRMDVGLNATEALYKYLVEELRVEAAVHGDKAAIHEFAFYDSARNAVYMDLGDGELLKLDGEKITQHPNGTDDVLFLPINGAQSWKYNPDVPEDSLASVLIDPLNFIDVDGPFGHTANEQRLLLLLWLLGLAFESVQPTKPLALAIGPTGAGKSNMFRRLGQLILGESFNVDAVRRDKEEDFWVATTNRSLVALDNVDRYVPWLEDALAQSATGIKVTKRVLFKTNEAVSFTPRAFLALTARTPKFRREDVAERLLIFHMDTIQEKRSESELRNEVLAQRGEFLSDYANMANRVVATPAPANVDTRIRLADFATIATRIGDGLGVGEPARAMLRKLRHAQFTFATEQNELFYALDTWLNNPPAHGVQHGLAQGDVRLVTTSELYQELKSGAEAHDVPFRWKSAIALGMELANMREALGIHFDIIPSHKEQGSAWSISRVDTNHPGPEGAPF